jgi:MFS family permease
MTPHNVKLLNLSGFFISLRFFAAIQVIYFAQVTGSYALAMSLFSVATISQALLEIPTGIFSDKYGRKNTMVFGVFAAFLSVTFYAVGQAYFFLLIGAVIEGLARALGSGNSQALMYDSLKDLRREEEYSKYQGRGGSLEHLGFGIAALIGGFIATRSFAVAMWLSAATQFLAFLVALFVQEPQTISKSELNPYAHLKESINAFRNNPKLRLLTIAKAWKESLRESAYQFSPAFINTLWPLWAIGILNIGSSFVTSAGFYLSEKAIKRFQEL